MEPDELTLSDVHLNISYTVVDDHSLNDYKVAVSRFLFRLKPEEQPSKCEATATDDDGDLVVSRPTQQFTDVIYIEHTLSTRLLDVGLQVWQGSLLLCDYILDNLDTFSNGSVLELGGGVGLASVTAAIVAKTVFCTDIGDETLAMCGRNAETNKSLYLHQTDKDAAQTVIKVRELDWTEESPSEDERHKKYYWRPDELELLPTIKIIIAADVIYDDDLTDAFFRTVYKLLSRPPDKTVFIALERRLNFTMNDLDVSCPAYNYFRQCVHELCQLSDEKIKLAAQQIDANSVQQYFQYDRIKYLELWQLSSHVIQ